jgi:hypothetical protein
MMALVGRDAVIARLAAPLAPVMSPVKSPVKALIKANRAPGAPTRMRPVDYERARLALMQQDPRLGAVIERVGKCRLKVRRDGDLFRRSARRSPRNSSRPASPT